VHQLEIKVLNIIDARCNHEVSPLLYSFFETLSVPPLKASDCYTRISVMCCCNSYIVYYSTQETLSWQLVIFPPSGGKMWIVII